MTSHDTEFPKELLPMMASSPPPLPAPAEPTVFIVDDDPSFLRSLARLLRASHFRVVVHASAVEFLAGLKPDMPGCVITDLRMPGMDGIALQEALSKAGSPLPIVFLTAHGDIPTTVQAIRGGAEDFLTKQAPKADLLAAVRRALARNEQDRALRTRRQALRQLFDSLTEREGDVLRQVVQGKLNKQIAAALGIHERTVKLHRTHITQKLRVHSVAELTRLVQDAGFETG
ncbi:MAG TPA: response regulator [Verrucomicrobiota bacterium]|nr:response regulator [Verrucomicrobiota bacterium]HNU52512.1 response regulator [Verrucomicrobiota bacterium]